ncbi:RNA-binding protein 12-like [Cimex lectularius]|uniref:RRM domain-containing protein n=1 Tax=Cimex lectularius TaxID=79782 RepID=A0A8I6RYG4_CIMLE|nr:RNA-binding protein 12-like [Cimex lectularius]XP_014252340.1 RNA-binding protein 12-like [Cimex lectularius]
MSVIIRLQNLPWSANAADIRTYFSGLSIPEGGVHIIGGEQGDAFIAFSTDEDARQAMLKDNGKLKEVKIKLFLSSRTEMLRVIEQARQQAMKIHSLMHIPNQPTNIPSVMSKTIAAPEETPENVKEDLNKAKDDDNRRDKRDRSTSRGRSRGRGSDSDRSHEKSRSRSYRDRERDRRRRDRSRSRSRTRSRDRYRSRRSRSRDRKRNSRDSDSKDAPRNNRNRDNRNLDRQDNKEGHGNGNMQDWNQSQFQPKLPDPPAIPPKLLQMHQNGKELSPTNASMPFMDLEKRGGFPFPNQMAPLIPPFPPMQQMRPREGGWPAMPIPPMIDPSQLAMQRPPMMNNMNTVMFPTPNMMSEAPPFDSSWRMNQMPPIETQVEPVIENSDLCVEIRGLPLNASYIDVKKLFDGLIIPSDGIKMINDTHGYRTGIAYVKFSNANHKKSALNQNGKKVRSNIVEVLHLRDTIYKTAVDNFKPDKDVILNSVDMDIDNSDVNEEKWPPTGNKHVSAEHDTSKHLLPKHEMSRKEDLLRTNWIILKGLPMGTNERDVFEYFRDKNLSLIQVFFVHNNVGLSIPDAYCCFLSNEDADKAASINNPVMGRTQFSILKTSREDAERATMTSFPQEPWNQGCRQVGGNNSVPQSFPPRVAVCPENINPHQNIKAWRQPNEDRFKKNDNFMEGRFKDPRNDSFSGRGGSTNFRGGGRMNRFGNGPMGNNGPPMNGPMKGRMNQRNRGPSPPAYIDGDMLENFGQRGCVVSLENIHFKADIEEIMDFFKEYNIEHDDVIRRFDDKGRPTGDARVALQSPAEAMRAVRELNFRQLRGRTVKVSLLDVH